MSALCHFDCGIQESFHFRPRIALLVSELVNLVIDSLYYVLRDENPPFLIPIFAKSWSIGIVMVFNGLQHFVATSHSLNPGEETMSRRARELTADQSVLVGAVRKVARQRSKVNTDYVMAILRAREEGATFGAIAEAAGTSSQAVQEIVRRHGPVKRSEPKPPVSESA